MVADGRGRAAVAWWSRGRRFESCRPDRSGLALGNRRLRGSGLGGRAARAGRAREVAVAAAPATEPPDRVWTVPNALSVLRLLGVPLFLWLMLGPHADGWAVVVLALSGVTDWADGKIARWLDQGSRLGALLDPAADRLYIVSALIALA